MSFRQRGNRCISNCSMLTLPEKALLVKLYCQNGESVYAALRSYCHKENAKDLLCASSGADLVLSHLFVTIDLPGPQTSIRVIIGCGVTWSLKSTVIVRPHQGC
ncbi:hypothetical protein TNCV_1285051 [Trichonephila clavipes]|uniref:Uncharacterized protein n=1 Tax=Trichonephila clavipes TaxID=2585209 RepID=A0A8X6VQA6_TRICX|nr:hypothetical protein TNCV_1285051 [Trichonephila clavipes]